MTDTQRLVRDSDKVGYIFDLVLTSLLFGRVCKFVERLANVVQRPTNHVSEVEQRALQLMKDRNALMRILAERPDYLIPGSYDDLLA